MAKLLYQGHASMRITTDEGKVIYIDPFIGEGYDEEADLILVTHEHYDHVQVNKVKLKKDALIIRSKDALKGGAYQNFDVCGIHVQTVPAYNKNHDVKECVGYMIDVDGVRIYHAGDTSKTEWMEDASKQGIDYAFLPVDGIYNMGPEEASECGALIAPKHLVPIHQKPDALCDLAQAEKVVSPVRMIVMPGQTIELKK